MNCNETNSNALLAGDAIHRKYKIGKLFSGRAQIVALEFVILILESICLLTLQFYKLNMYTGTVKLGPSLIYLQVPAGSSGGVKTRKIIFLREKLK